MDQERKKMIDDLPNFLPGFRKILGNRNSSMVKLSKQINRNYDSMVRQIKAKDMRVSLVIELSRAMGRNLFQNYITRLPEELRETGMERQLSFKLKQMEEEMAKREKKWQAEREKYEYTIAQMQKMGSWKM